MMTYQIMDTGEEFEIEIPDSLKGLQLFDNMMTCAVCGEMFRDTGRIVCPYCSSDEINPMYDEDEEGQNENNHQHGSHGPAAGYHRRRR